MVSQDVLRFRRGDCLAVAFVLLLALAVTMIYLPAGKAAAAYAEVYQHGELLRTVSLLEDQEFVVDGAYVNVVRVQGGRIGIVSSDCPGADCVHSGDTGTAGRSIVCLPNGVELRVVGEVADVDFVVR